jgi:phosphohistidine phosphatase SixA
MKRAAVLCLLITSAVALAAHPAAAQATVVLVRHAERADGGTPPPGATAPDPELSPAGHARAAALARMLADARITAIYTTEYKRTQQTAAPLAKALGLQATALKAAEPTPLLEALKAASGVVLVVGHSNTVPDVIMGLGVRTRVAIADNEYDNLFVVSPGPSPQVLRLRYE